MSDQGVIPPSFPRKLLKWFCDPEMLEDVEGDIAELFSTRAAVNRSKAQWLYWRDVFFLFRPGIIKNFEINNGLTNTGMLKNYLKITLRNALRYKGYTALNLLGLIVGIATSMLILLWVHDEISIDQFHERDNVYQVFRNMRQTSGEVNTTYTVPKPVADLMRAEYPEVSEVAQMSWPTDYLLQVGDKRTEEEGRIVTQSFLDLFSYQLVLGDRSTCLTDPSSILISVDLAEKLFGDSWKEQAMGYALRIDDTYDLKITGVFQDPGMGSSIDFEWLSVAEAFYSRNSWVNDWGNGSFAIFFTTANEETANVVAERLYSEILDHTQDNDNAGDETLVIQKYKERYLYSTFENGQIVGGRITYVRIMSFVSLFILVLACINFMNLATARAARRAKEVGVRKTMGASRPSLATQFFFEAFALSFLAVLVSVVVVFLVLPFFNELTGKMLTLDLLDPQVWLFLLTLIFSVTLLSGIYPAVLLPSLNTVDSMKGLAKSSGWALHFRRLLVIFQFCISTFIIIGTFVVFGQTNYVLSKDLGLDKENIVAVRMKGDLHNRVLTYQEELRQIPQVQAVTAASGNPIRYGRSTSSANWEGKPANAGYEINVILTDEHFISTMGMEIAQGRDFERQSSDSTNFLINEVAADLMGFDDPIGKKLSFWGIEGRIVGVVRNFHMQNLYEAIAPLIITCIEPTSTAYSLVRLQGSPGEALQRIEAITAEMNPGFGFEYEFLDRVYAEGYQAEITIGKLSGIFAGISIFISCLGLLALSAYATEQRSKEIGVRRVHGASVASILSLLVMDFSRLVLVAALLAVPIGYYFSDQWLDNFEFRMSLGLAPFVTAGFLTIITAVFVVGLKSYSAAASNPVRSLREE